MRLAEGVRSPYNGLYGETLPETGYVPLSLWSWKGPNKGLRSSFYGVKDSAFRLQVQGLQCSKLVMRKEYHLSIEGIRKEFLFL